MLLLAVIKNLRYNLRYNLRFVGSKYSKFEVNIVYPFQIIMD